jgi:hypothetical protein
MRLGYLVGSVVALLLCGGFLAAAYLGPGEIYKLLNSMHVPLSQVDWVLQMAFCSRSLSASRILPIKRRKRLMGFACSYSSLGYPQWQDTRAPNSPPTYLKFYLFNVTNPDEVCYAGDLSLC